MLNGIQVSRNVKYRVRCPVCGEKLLPPTECPFCELKIRKQHGNIHHLCRGNCPQEAGIFAEPGRIFPKGQ